MIVLLLARRRKARIPVRFDDAERPDQVAARRLGRTGQQQVEHRTFPTEYEEHEQAAKRVHRVRHVPVVRRRVHRPPRDHFEHERHSHQTEQL